MGVFFYLNCLSVCVCVCVRHFFEEFKDIYLIKGDTWQMNDVKNGQAFLKHPLFLFLSFQVGGKSRLKLTYFSNFAEEMYQLLVVYYMHKS